MTIFYHKMICRLIILGLLLCCACDDQNSPSPSSLATDQGIEQSDMFVHSALDMSTNIAVEPTSARQLRRVSVEQLLRMLPQVTGGIRWVEDFGQGPVDILELLAPSLGAPDYRGVTHELLEPNLLMSKFLSDGAQRVCHTWVQQDRSALGAERTLVKPYQEGLAWDDRSTAQVRYNLKRLLLRFFAFTVTQDDHPRLQALEELFNTVVATSPTDPSGDAWFAVCLALMTDPEFTLY